MTGAAEAEFAAFVAERTHALFGTAYALTGDQRAAERLLRSALATLARHWHHAGADPERYARRVIHRAYVSPWRRGWQRGWRPAPTPSADALRAGLAALPARQRAVLVLVYLEDRDEREVAEILGRSARAVRRDLTRALATLGAALPTGPAVGRPAVAA
jgi:DNA-directed RNA polymerase specialized sigma24 family protein